MEEVSHKRCGKCGEVKPLDEFHRDARAKDGRRNDCKVCNRSRARSYGNAHREERRQRSAQWRADNSEYVRQRRREKYVANPEVTKERNRVRYETNRELYRERNRQYRKEVRDQVFEHYGRGCVCCGATDNLTIDHVDGGGTAHRLEVLGFAQGKVAGWVFYRWLIKNDFPEGFQVLCFPCNQSKCNTGQCRLDHSRPRDAPIERCTAYHRRSQNLRNIGHGIFWCGRTACLFKIRPMAPWRWPDGK